MDPGIIRDQANRTAGRKREIPHGRLAVYLVIYAKPRIYRILTGQEESRPASTCEGGGTDFCD